MARAIAIVIFFLSLNACSLMGLDEFPLKECASDDDCVVFNTFQDIDPSCRAFYCHNGACLRYGEGVEVRDFADNDCDGLIDEPGFDEGGVLLQTIKTSGVKLVTGIGSGAKTAFFVDAEGGAAAAWWDAENGEAFHSSLTADASPTEMSYWRGAYEPGNPELNQPNLLDTTLQSGCYRLLSDQIVEGTCDFTEVALGLGAERALVASVSSAACSVGQLRLGSFDRGADPEVVLRGPFRRSNSYLGVDLNSMGICTGGSRPGCGESGAPCGAARPAMAMIEGDVDQTLVAYLGDGPGRSECGGAAVNVEAIAAFQMVGDFGGIFHWMTASGEGVPTVLGRSMGGGPPAVIAMGTAGYLVAYGDQRGKLALHVVPRAEDPPEYDGTSCEDPCDGVDYREDQVTAPLSGIVPLDVVAGSGAGTVDWPALGPGAMNNGSFELGLAWRDGCGSADEAVYFQRLSLSISGGLPSSIAEMGEVQRLSPELSGGGKIGPPTLMYTTAPFLVEGFERGGEGPVTSESDGGWLIAWAQRTDGGSQPRLLARRICELDGKIFDEHELLDLTVDGTEPQVEGPPPSLHGTMESIDFAYHDVLGRAIVVGELVLVELAR